MSEHNIGDLVYYEMYGLGMITKIRYEAWKKGYDYNISFFKDDAYYQWYDAGFIPDMKRMVEKQYAKASSR